MSVRPLALILMALAPPSGVLATSAAGETPPLPDLGPGSRLRLKVRGEVAVQSGRLVSSDGTGLVLEDGKGRSRRSLPWEAIDALEVGHRSTVGGLGAGILVGSGTAALLGAAESGLGGLLYGALGGAVLALPAAVVGVAAGGGPRPTKNGGLSGAAIGALVIGAVGAAGCSSIPEGNASTEPTCILASAAIGAGWGALAGGVAGHVSRERWRPAWTRGISVGLGPVRGHGLAVAVRVSF